MLFAAPESNAGVLVLRVETELAFGAAAFVVGVPCSACDQELVRVLFACRRCPFPEVAVHVVHAPPAAALSFAAASLGGFRVCVALALLVAVAVRILESVFATAGGLPFVDGAEVLAFVCAEAGGFFLAYHVFWRGVWLVRVFVGIDADGLCAYGNRECVLSADVVACHVVFGFFPGGAVSDGIFGVEEYRTGLVVVKPFACVLRVERIADGNERLAFYFVALDFELDGVVVTTCWRRDFGGGRDFVRIAEAVGESSLVQGILLGLIESC